MASNTAKESWHHQRLNPGTLDPIAPAVTGIEPLRQAVVFEVSTTALLNFTKNPAHICAYSKVPVKLNGGDGSPLILYVVTNTTGSMDTLGVYFQDNNLQQGYVTDHNLHCNTVLAFKGEYLSYMLLSISQSLIVLLHQFFQTITSWEQTQPWDRRVIWLDIFWAPRRLVVIWLRFRYITYCWCTRTIIRNT